MTELGTLGGTFSGAIAVNDSGDIAGFSYLPGSEVFHGVLWANGRIFDLKALRDDQCSLVSAVNLQTVAVGFSVDCSFDESTFRATISECGQPMVDLNTLIPPDSGVTLANAVYINDRGEIAVVGHLTDGTHLPVLLVPCDNDNGSEWGNSKCENVGHPPHRNSKFTGAPSSPKPNSIPKEVVDVDTSKCFARIRSLGQINKGGRSESAHCRMSNFLWIFKGANLRSHPWSVWKNRRLGVPDRQSGNFRAPWTRREPSAPWILSELRELTSLLHTRKLI